jgi:hypothetical protein
MKGDGNTLAHPNQYQASIKLGISFGHQRHFSLGQGDVAVVVGFSLRGRRYNCDNG